MLLCKYFNPALGHETEEKIEDNDYISFAGRNPEETPASCCIKVVASGAWMERIRKHFTNLPLMETGAYSPTIAWYGDHAKFIAGNIADVCSAYFQMWMGEAACIHGVARNTKCDRCYAIGINAIPVKDPYGALQKIKALIKDHSINDLERTVAIQQVLDDSL